MLAASTSTLNVWTTTDVPRYPSNGGGGAAAAATCLGLCLFVSVSLSLSPFLSFSFSISLSLSLSLSLFLSHGCFANLRVVCCLSVAAVEAHVKQSRPDSGLKLRVIDSGLVGSTDGESKRCSRDTYPESYITKYTSLREEIRLGGVIYQIIYHKAY